AVERAVRPSRLGRGARPHRFRCVRGPVRAWKMLDSGAQHRVGSPGSSTAPTMAATSDSSSPSAASRCGSRAPRRTRRSPGRSRPTVTRWTGHGQPSAVHAEARPTPPRPPRRCGRGRAGAADRPRRVRRAVPVLRARGPERATHRDRAGRCHPAGRGSLRRRSNEPVRAPWLVSPRRRSGCEIDVRDVQTQPCSGFIVARPGDRIAIAFEGHDFAPAQVVNAVAWLGGEPPPFDGIESTTIGAIYARLGRVPPVPASPDAAAPSIDWPIGARRRRAAPPPALTLGPAHCYDAGTAVSTLAYRVLTSAGERAWRVETVAHSAPWTSALKRSFGPSSRNTSRRHSPSAARRSSSAMASACPVRPFEASSRSSKLPGC
ncbi:MAG: hypothetical protein K0S97_955, partial [Chloroflexota bacterium]|nr:hypothetical protein [Chloroflexota bacterium]